MTTKPNAVTISRNFPLGQICATAGAIEAISFIEVMSALQRHTKCDWGDIEPEDWAENELSLKEGFRLFSAYRSSQGVKFWIITEADRTATTILLPNEY